MDDEKKTFVAWILLRELEEPLEGREADLNFTRVKLARGESTKLIIGLPELAFVPVHFFLYIEDGDGFLVESVMIGMNSGIISKYPIPAKAFEATGIPVEIHFFEPPRVNTQISIKVVRP